MKLKEECIQEDDVFDNPLLHLPLTGLKYYGILLSEGQRWKALHNFRGLFFTASILIFNVTQYADLYQIWGDFAKMTDNAPTTLLFTTTLFWIFEFYRNRARYNRLTTLAHEGVEHILRFGTDRERSILRLNAKYVKWVSIVFWVCAFVTVYGSLFFTVLEYLSGNFSNRSTSSLLRSWYPGGYTRQNFVPILAIHVYACHFGMMMILCWHMFVMSLMVYARVGLTILNHRLAHLGEYVASELRSGREIRELDDPEEQRRENRRELIVECIQTQMKLNEFTKELESLIEKPVFLDFVVFSVLLCTQLFATSVETNMMVLFLHITYIQMMLVILFIYYWHANEIDFQYNLLSSSAFQSDWFNYPPTINKMVSYFMLYNTKPRTMKAFFVPISVETFIRILRAAYSYFTILKQMAE